MSFEQLQPVTRQYNNYIKKTVESNADIDILVKKVVKTQSRM